MRKHKKTFTKPHDAATAKPADPFRPWLLAGMVALLVAGPLVPGESAATEGDGLPLVMLWLALAVLWAAGAIGRRHFTLHFGPVDALVLLLLASQCAAALYAVRHGSPRPAMNMLWEWVSLGLVFFLARQLIPGAGEVRAVVAATIALAAAISVYGFYQAAIERPATQKQFAADPEGMLRAAGLNYPPGTPLRDLFEKRLANREPTATFALTNSLAAALAPWLVMGLAALAATWRQRRQRTAWIVALVPMAGCLLWTKSRSGWVAAAVGVVWLAIAWWRSSRHNGSRHTPCAVRPAVPTGGSCKRDAIPPDGTRSVPNRMARRLLCGAVVAGVLAAVAIAGFVKPGAAVSLGYRFQYWQATLRMIAARPWLGCGPGNFQDVYTQYQLPGASEEIADPHNFLLEVWATAGTPALLALLGVLGLFAANCRAAFSLPPIAEGVKPAPPPCKDWRFAIVGLIGGFLLSAALGQISFAPPSIFVLLIGLPVAMICMILLIPWVRAGTFSPALAGVGVAVLLIDLLTTGGIGIPGVAQSLWLLLAVGLGGAWPRQAPRGAGIALLAIGLGLAVACQQTAYARVLPSQGFQRLARREYFDGQREAALESMQKAVAEDPWSSDAQGFLADIYLDFWLARPRAADYNDFETHDALARQMAPQAAPVWRASAARYRRAFEKTDSLGRRVQPGAIEQAVASARRTVELYPRSDNDRAALAVIYQLAGDNVAYRREAQAALELDRQMPHADKKLSDSLRRQLEAAASDTERAKPAN